MHLPLAVVTGWLTGFGHRSVLAPTQPPGLFESLEPRTLLAAAPVIDSGEVDLHPWIAEEQSGGAGTASWNVSPDGSVVTQSLNGLATVFHGHSPVFGTPLHGSISQSGGGDDDYIGFVLGWNSGEFLDLNADFLLLDWKMQTSGPGTGGLAVSWLRGDPQAADYWAHTGTLTELARGNTLGQVGWQRDTTYNFTMDYTADRLRVYVDNVLEVDLAVPDGMSFPDGSLGFYNMSQEGVTYSAFSSDGVADFEGQPVTVSKSFTDADGNTDHTATIDWGDGTQTAGVITYDGGVGTITDTHTYADQGDYSIQVTVADAQGNSSDTLNASIVNAAPTASDNDHDIDEDQSLDGMIAAADAGNDTLGFALDGQPANGTVQLDANTGDYTYSPNADFNGNDSFTITVDDGEGGQTTATVNVTINAINDAPTASNNAHAFDEDDAVNGWVIASDVENDGLSYAVAAEPEHGAVALDNATGQYTYTPQADYFGADQFTVTVTDTHGAATTMTVALTIHNVDDTPTAPVVARTKVKPGRITAGWINALEKDGQALTFTFNRKVRHGRIKINRRTGRYRFIPNARFKARDSFSVRISDGTSYTIARIVFRLPRR